MAKSKSAPTCCGPSSADSRKYEIEDALRTLTRAEEVKADKTLMAGVEKLAKEKAREMNTIAGSLAKKGLISDKQEAKLKGKKAA